MFRSTDLHGGWTAVGNGLSNHPVRALTAAGARIFAGTEGGGVYLSSDAGQSWAAVNDGLPALDVAALGTDGVNVLAATGFGVYRRGLAEFDQVLAADPRRPAAPDLILSPNPMRDRVTIALDERIVGVRVVDLTGRRVRGWSTPPRAGAGPELVWDGRDDRGERVAPGVYRVECTAENGARRSARVALVR